MKGGWSSTSTGTAGASGDGKTEWTINVTNADGSQTGGTVWIDDNTGAASSDQENEIDLSDYDNDRSDNQGDSDGPGNSDEPGEPGEPNDSN